MFITYVICHMPYSATDLHAGGEGRGLHTMCVLTFLGST